jgi:FKBP-type peptidyl-prolyl cis-trans isomerase FkpA
MKFRLLLITLLISLFTASCNRFSKYPGYKRAKHGIYYQLHSIGDDTARAQPGDFVTVNLAYFTTNDSLFFTGTRKLQVNEPAYKGAIDECFSMLSGDESATFIIAANEFFSVSLQTARPGFIKNGDPMKIRIEMVEIETEEDYLREKEAFLSWIDDFGDYEKVILHQFIQEEKLDVNPLPSGIYFLNLKAGSGKKVEPGDTVTVHYEGRFLNGKFFDSTIKRKQPFQFVYGTEWQVVKGLEEAIGMMREGEKALIILPSELAFGNTGSSNNAIPPFTSLIFEVEILKVSS